jgi:predicted CXXCH cytochrome family protein
LLLAEGGALCVTCHKDIETAAKSEHGHPPAASGDCLSCHNPHSSKNADLLKLPVPQACTSCHNTEDSGFRNAHLGEAGASMNCVSCHDAHGSTEKGLFMARKHAPFESNDCSVCHVATPTEGGKQ